MAKVRETLASLDGVEKVEVDFAAKTATVTAKKDAKVEVKAARAALKEKGYGSELKKDG